MDSQLPLAKIPGVGSYYSFKLKLLGIKTIEDLIYHFPFRYDDFSNVESIKNAVPGEILSFTGTIWEIANIRTRSGKFLTKATVADPSGVMEAIWFNQPYLTKTLKAGTPVSVSGKVELDGRRLKMVAPSYEIVRNQVSTLVRNSRHPEAKPKDLRDSSPLAQNDKIGQTQTLHTGRLVPVYPETEGLSSKWLRNKIAHVLPDYLDSLKDFLPNDIISSLKLITLADALVGIHFPKNYQDVESARIRLGFDELFLIQIATQIRKKEWHHMRRAPKMTIDMSKVGKLISNLPFKLTKAQIKAVDQILADLEKQTPANRLLEGDVGSGKTIVAAIAAFIAYLNGFETLLAAPTEILTFQHQNTLMDVLSPFGIKVGIWTGSKKEKGDITVGTHALLSSFTPTKEIGLVVVDEQHRFGVAQRAKLFRTQDSKLTPHLLTMTATPIPRTLALTLYGDLDLSVLDEMPKGRQKIATFVVPNAKRQDAYKFIAGEVKNSRQAFIVTPFVEPSETMASVRAAKLEFEKLTKLFSNLSLSHSRLDRESLGTESSDRSGSEEPSGSMRRISDPHLHEDDRRHRVKLGLLHGRLKSGDKEKVIGDFKAGKIDILVTTPVVEVGIDVANATIMMIESAERFGLAQLHQLRGRVGRGHHKSYCLLFTDSTLPQSIKRLKSMEKVHAGFELAEIDLKMRGPGEVFGLKQSGYMNLKIADLGDHQAISQAQKEAQKIIEKDSELKSYPLLAQKIERLQSNLAQPN